MTKDEMRLWVAIIIGIVVILLGITFACVIGGDSNITCRWACGGHMASYGQPSGPEVEHTSRRSICNCSPVSP